MVSVGDLYGDFKTLCKQWFYEKSEVDTALNSKQNNLISGTNIKTINNTSLLGSGNIDIQGGGSGGSCVTDFYIDSNTDEWVITTSACSQGEVVTQWEQTLSDEKVPSEKLVKNTIDGFVQYGLSSSDYNPNVGSTITITCTCKNILGNPIANKTLELMMNGVSQGTSTTNANGIATWTITFGAWGNKHFYIGNATLDLVVTGWKQIGTYASNKITLYSDGKWGMVTISGTWSNSTSGEVVLATINSEYSPFSNVSTNHSYGVGSYQPVYTRGTNICINRSGTGNYGVYCTLYFRLSSPKY